MICPKCTKPMYYIVEAEKEENHQWCLWCGTWIFDTIGQRLPYDYVRFGKGRAFRTPKKRTYGAVRRITDEDWELGNKAIAEKYGISESWASHNRPHKMYKRRDDHGIFNTSGSEAKTDQT